MNRYAAALFAAGFVMQPIASHAEAVVYNFDKSHTDIFVSWSHFGFSTGTGEFLDYDGTVALDETDPTNSSIDITFQVAGFDTDWEKREEHFSSADFFDVANHPIATFKSNSVELTGEKTASVTGDLTIKGVTKPVTLDVTLNAIGNSPVVEGLYVAGFDATTTFLRSDYDLGLYAPAVSDEVTIQISTELNRH